MSHLISAVRSISSIWLTWNSASAVITTVRSSRSKEAWTPLKSKRLADDPAGLVDRIGQLVQIDFRNNIK